MNNNNQSIEEQVLNTRLADLYRLAAGQPTLIKLPIKVIDSPLVAQKILINSDKFIKNYKFFDSFSTGRFTENGQQSKLRAKLTQPYYLHASKKIGKEKLQYIYRKHLLDFSRGLSPNLFQTFLDASLEVISLGFGLKETIPWPAEWLARVRYNLTLQQSRSWITQGTQCFDETNKELQQSVLEIKSLWQKRSEINDLLASFVRQSEGITAFDAAGELLLNLLAASETVSSSMMWMIDSLSRDSNIQEALRQSGDDVEHDLFIKECLRLFPPVAMVTRISSEACDINGVTFLENESMIISIVGIHCQPQYWQNPLQFQPKRQAFIDDSYNRAAYVPFLAGPRVCGGMKLALAELNVALREVVSLFEINQTNEPMSFEYGLASRPGANIDRLLHLRQ